MVRIAAAGALLAWFCRAHLPKFDREIHHETAHQFDQPFEIQEPAGWHWFRVWTPEKADETFPTVYLGEHRRALENPGSHQGKAARFQGKDPSGWNWYPR